MVFNYKLWASRFDCEQGLIQDLEKAVQCNLKRNTVRLRNVQGSQERDKGGSSLRAIYPKSNKAMHTRERKRQSSNRPSQACLQSWVLRMDVVSQLCSLFVALHLTHNESGLSAYQPGCDSSCDIPSGISENRLQDTGLGLQVTHPEEIEVYTNT